MLKDSPPFPERARRRQSLRQDYEEFILQRIEEYKDQLSRRDLLAIADDAVQELEVGPEGQLVLTEVLVREYVDRLIMRRLNLPTFRHWRDRHLKLREAQREPTHWGLDPDTPLARLARRCDDSDLALIVGGGGAAASLLLAAHDWSVLLIARELSVVEGAETRAAAEALGSRFHALVVGMHNWFPDVTPTLAVLDGTTLSDLESSLRGQFLTTLRDRTPTGGAHYLLPRVGQVDEQHALIQSLESEYRGWQVERGGCRGGSRWLLAFKP